MEMIISKKNTPLLTLNDVKDLLIEPNASSMAILAAITSVARKAHRSRRNYNSAPGTLHDQHNLFSKKSSSSSSLPPQQKSIPHNYGSFSDDLRKEKNKEKQVFSDQDLYPKQSHSPPQESRMAKNCYINGVVELSYPLSDSLNREKNTTHENHKRRREPLSSEDDVDVDTDVDHEYEDNTSRRNSKKTNRVNNNSAYSTPVDQDYMPEKLKQLIVETKGGTDLKLVIQKTLTLTDTERNQNRLLIPINQILNKFLTENEEKYLMKDDDDNNNKKRNLNAINAKIIEPKDIYSWTSINFKRWEMKKKNGATTTCSYVLNKTWYKMLKRNGLKVGETVQLWAFRINGDLNFALVNVSRSGSSSSNSPVSCETEHLSVD